jgi:hypothetical protein
MEVIASKMASLLDTNPNNAELNKILRAIADVDRKVEAASKPSLDAMWKAINAGIAPSADDVKKTLAARPSPLTQIFLEAALPTETEVMEAVASGPAKSESAHSVVKFFLQTLIGQPLGPVDEKIMDTLDSIESTTLAEPEYGFKISFKFSPEAKKFFKNDVLTVTVKSEGAESASCKFAESAITGVFGTQILWNPPEANPTVQRIPVPPTAKALGGKKDRDGKPRKEEPKFVEVKQDSIFRIFEDIDFSKQLPSGKNPDEEMELNMELERRGKLASGLILFHQVSAGLPILSLKRLTPDDEDDMGGDDDDGQMFGTDDEMEDGDFDDEDDDDDDVAPPPKKSSKKDGGASAPAPSASKGVKPQPECKQQ